MFTHYDLFLEFKKTSEETLINELRPINSEPQFYLSLNQFVQYLNSRGLHPNSVRTYFAFFKAYFRHIGFRIYNEDVKQFVKLPKIPKEQKAPLSMDEIAVLYNNSGPKMKCIISCLVSSGMRISELLQLRINDIEGQKVRIRAENTKTKSERITYISLQARNDLKPFLRGKQPEAFALVTKWQALNSLALVEKEFYKLRSISKLEKKYRLSNIHHITLHRFRAFVKTNASDLHGKDYAEGLIGHEGYLSTYYAQTEKEKFRQYKELEPKLTIPIFK